MTVRASPIQTLTVGTGIPPVQPLAFCIRMDAEGLRVADYDRRFGLTPTPEHVCVIAIVPQPHGAAGYSRPSS